MQLLHQKCKLLFENEIRSLSSLVCNDIFFSNVILVDLVETQHSEELSILSANCAHSEINLDVS